MNCSFRTAGIIGLLSAIVVTAASCGSGSSSSGGGGGSTGTGGPPMSINAASQSVTFNVIAAQGTANGGYNFNGDSNGKMVMTVPQGWKVTINCTNAGQMSHSCAIVQSASSNPNGGQVVFPGASTPTPQIGFDPGQSQSFTFTAGAVGNYRIACLVAGHEDSGMWDQFNVVATGVPSLKS